MGKLLSFTLALVVAVPTAALSGNIAITGSWSETIDANDLVAGAGSTVNSTYESAADAITVDLTAIGVGDSWDIEISMTEGTWSSNFTLWARRTSAGTGPGTVSGGMSYQEITSTPTTLFSGTGSRNDIEVQLQLTGVALSEPLGANDCTVTYDLIEP